MGHRPSVDDHSNGQRHQGFHETSRKRRLADPNEGTKRKAANEPALRQEKTGPAKQVPFGFMVPAARLELARPHQALDFESNASTDSTIRARRFLEGKRFEL